MPCWFCSPCFQLVFCWCYQSCSSWTSSLRSDTMPWNNASVHQPCCPYIAFLWSGSRRSHLFISAHFFFHVFFIIKTSMYFCFMHSSTSSLLQQIIASSSFVRSKLLLLNLSCVLIIILCFVGYLQFQQESTHHRSQVLAPHQRWSSGHHPFSPTDRLRHMWCASQTLVLNCATQVCWL